MERESASSKFSIGSDMPKFNLKATDGNSYGDDYLKAGKASLVIFTCNHCPYVKGSEKMLNDSIADFLEEGFRVVAICSNDSIGYPDDSFEKMKEKNKIQQILIQFVRTQLRSNQTLSKDTYRALIANLNQYSKDSYQGKALLYLDAKIWAESKLKGKTIEALKQEAGG